MFNPKCTALYLAVSAMAFAAGEASAGCKYIPNPPGSLVCASWIQGSEICEITTTGQTAGSELVSGTCSVTAFNFIDGAEGASGTDGAYCSSGTPPLGVCESTSPDLTLKKVSTTSTSSTKAKPCKPKHGDKHDGSVGHNDCSITLPTGGALSEPLTALECHDQDAPTDPDTGRSDCTAEAEIFPPPGSTCPNGLPAQDFTATAMLAIAEICTDDGSGPQCAKIYDICLDNGDGGYDCVDITDQGERCSTPGGGFLTFDPDDPSCGKKRAACVLEN